MSGPWNIEAVCPRRSGAHDCAGRRPRAMSVRRRTTASAPTRHSDPGFSFSIIPPLPRRRSGRPRASALACHQQSGGVRSGTQPALASVGGAEAPAGRAGDGRRHGRRTRRGPRRRRVARAPPAGGPTRHPMVFVDGETRTRTGDTTIFSRAVDGLEWCPNPWKQRVLGRWTQQPKPRSLRSFAASSGDEVRLVSRSRRCWRRSVRQGLSWPAESGAGTASARARGVFTAGWRTPSRAC